jgi:hypothetical protein
VLADGSPQVALLSNDAHELVEAMDPAAYGLVADLNASLGMHLLHVTAALG